MDPETFAFLSMHEHAREQYAEHHRLECSFCGGTGVADTNVPPAEETECPVCHGFADVCPNVTECGFCRAWREQDDSATDENFGFGGGE